METICNQAILQDDESDLDVMYERLQEVERKVCDKYGDKLNISSHRIYNFVSKHIPYLRSRDSIFEQYLMLHNHFFDTFWKRWKMA